METEAVVKKWGNSLGVILPKEFVTEGNIEENDRVMIDVRKEADLRPIFGSLKAKMSGQEFKNLVRKGWNNGN